MEDKRKTRKHLLEELGDLRGRVARLEAEAAGRGQAEEELRYRAHLLEQLATGINVVHARDGTILYVHPQFEAMLGYGPGELVGRHISVVNAPAEKAPAETAEEIMQCLNDTGRWSGEIKNARKDGSIVWCNAKVVAADHPEHGRVWVSVHEDITDRKRAEEQQALAVRVLKLLNKASERRDCIRDILLLVKDATGSDAVGIRLAEGDDFPYYEANGFPLEFVEAEKHLCEYDGSGKPVRDADGNACLDCMCGNVIRGRTDPTEPFFTRGGSFWTNSTTELLASTSEGDRQARTRNRCNGEGYESVALVPLRAGTDTIGLLQLNDRRRNMLTVGQIVFLEGLGASIGIALARKQSDEKLRAYQNQLRSLASELSLAEERERRRIAAGLHDRVTQDLIATAAKLARCSEGMTNPKYAKCASDVQEHLARAIREARTLTFDLGSPILYELGLVAALEEMVGEFQEKHGIRSEFEDDGKAKPLGSDLGALVFQAVRELLVNVVKHAKANRLTVSTTRDDEGLKVVVEDDGVGFDVAEATSAAGKAMRFGLFGIRERLDYLGGEMRLESEPGRGTRITLVVPLKEAQ